MSASAARRPARLLTQNSEMRQIGVWNWSLPAWAGRLADGRTYNTCPSAGVCAEACYARHGTYTWPVVRAKHQANLMYVLDDLDGWRTAMVDELGAAKFRGSWIRIHDSGDFFSVLWGASACGVTLRRSSVWRPMRRFSGGVALWLFVAEQRGAET
ncbi:GP88 family protein, partial [Amycolatopsis sp. cmx-4-61]|uniref:GP88 family protein n=1 Tax=Amycolatopsis sp. cmx-4-61 TaxID=2790937 RepID=UPI003979D9BD